MARKALRPKEFKMGDVLLQELEALDPRAAQKSEAVMMGNTTYKKTRAGVCFGARFMTLTWAILKTCDANGKSATTVVKSTLKIVKK